MKVILRWKLSSDESLKNCQRSDKEWWLVTFRLWRCFMVCYHWKLSKTTGTNGCQTKKHCKANGWLSYWKTNLRKRRFYRENLKIIALRKLWGIILRSRKASQLLPPRSSPLHYTLKRRPKGGKDKKLVVPYAFDDSQMFGTKGWQLWAHNDAHNCEDPMWLQEAWEVTLDSGTSL